MILVDTSVWVQHLRRGSRELEALLPKGEVICHPFIIGELACGSMKNRSEILGLLKSLPQGVLAENDEVLALVDQHRMYGRGLGWVDVHLIASALLSDALLWTLDRPLRQAADELGIRYSD